MNLKYVNIAGAFLIVGVVQFVIMLIIAMALFGFVISSNYISDLGAMCRANFCIVVQPSSTIFNSSVITLGVFLCIASYFILRGARARVLSTLIAVAGVGAIGVGVFPESAGLIHAVFALITFLFGGLALISSHKILSGFVRVVVPIMGFVSLVLLIFFALRIDLGLGVGGVEMLIVFLELLATIIIGSFLAGLRQFSL